MKNVFYCLILSLTFANAFAKPTVQAMYKCYNNLGILNFSINIETEDGKEATYSYSRKGNRNRKPVELKLLDPIDSINSEGKDILSFKFNKDDKMKVVLVFSEDAKGKRIIKSDFVNINPKLINPKLAERFERGYCETQVVQW